MSIELTSSSSNGTSNVEQQRILEEIRNLPKRSRESRRQGRYWLLTIPHEHFTPYLPPGIQWIKGQLERGGNTDYLHWQFVLSTPQKVSIRFIQQLFGVQMHAELTNSKKAEDYVWKDETCVSPTTRFELGRKKSNRDPKHDWEAIRQSAIQNDLHAISPDVYVRYFSSLERIASRHFRPAILERESYVFWGPTATGKSHTAWAITNMCAYPKNPLDKWWDSYQGQEDVVIDEFRGGIPFPLLLRWTDKFPQLVQTKGSNAMLRVKRMFFTSNVHPREWYPDLDSATQDAILRRLKIYEFPVDYERCKRDFNLS